MKHPGLPPRRAGWAAAAIALLLAVSTAPAVQAAAAPTAAATAPAGAAPPANPANAHPTSPHARAARQRALAKAEAAPATGIRVSPFTTKRKPQKPTAAH
jgi:hypothetical protein